MTQNPTYPPSVVREIQEFEARASAAMDNAKALAKRARDAAKTARRANEELAGAHRKRRDQARYIVGGLVIARLLSDPEKAQRWLSSYTMSSADRALVEEALAPVLEVAADIEIEVEAPRS